MSRGTFANGASNIGIGSGMVMSTGSVSILAGPNSSNSTNGGFNVLASDPDLRTLIPTYDLYDANVIEFDFTPTANTVSFDFLFGSEEYCEYVGTQFNDVFGFFVTGPGISGVANLAVIPNTTTPVTTNNVNHVLNSQYYFNNNYNIISCGLAVTDPVIFRKPNWMAGQPRCRQNCLSSPARLTTSNWPSPMCPTGCSTLPYF